MEELLELVGLGADKTIALDCYENVWPAKSSWRPRVLRRLNFSFLGNPAREDDGCQDLESC